MFTVFESFSKIYFTFCSSQVFIILHFNLTFPVFNTNPSCCKKEGKKSKLFIVKILEGNRYHSPAEEEYNYLLFSILLQQQNQQRVLSGFSNEKIEKIILEYVHAYMLQKNKMRLSNISKKNLCRLAKTAIDVPNIYYNDDARS